MQKMRFVEDKVYLIVEKKTGWIFSVEREEYPLHNRKYEWVEAICKREQVYRPSKLASQDYGWYDTGNEQFDLIDDDRVYIVVEGGSFLVDDEVAKFA